MARSHIIRGYQFHRRSIIKLGVEERNELASAGSVLLRRPVVWPLPERIPYFAGAYPDPGGTDIWGPGPYLKIPNRPSDDLSEDNEVVNRIFCPWGYPPDRLRIARRAEYVRLTQVGLEQTGSEEWCWLLTIEPWLAP